MKKIFLAILMLLPMLFVGCKQEELVFEYENIHFETKANAILLELVVPSSTAPTDQIYVIGEFNDNKISPEFLMTKHEDTNIKFGIYLYPEDFVNGKTLADGFTFFNMKQGNELLKNNELHVLENAQVGERYVISFGRWAGLGGGDEPVVPGEYEHCYLIGNIAGSGWKPAEPVELEMVGTDIFRGEVTFESDATAYFAVLTAKGADNDDWATVNAARWGAGNALLSEGEVLDLQLQDGSDQCVTITPGTYTISVNLATKQIAIGEDVEWKPAEPEKPSKYEHLYVTGNIEGSSWDPANPIELERVGRDLFRGEITFTSETSYFAFATAKGEWADFNDARWGGVSNDFLEEGGVVVLTNEVKEPCVTIAQGTYTITVNMIFKEVVIGEGDWSGREEPAEEEPSDEPGDEPGVTDTVYVTLHDTITTRLYLVDNTTGTKNNIYVWGNDYTGTNTEVFGGWPGAAWTNWQKVSFLGTEFYYYEFQGTQGQAVNVIFNGDGQYNAFSFTVGTKTDLFYTVTDTEATPLAVTPSMVAALRRQVRK